MQAEIITIGDELLIGQVVDTNSAWLGSTLGDDGIKVIQITSVQDHAAQIVQAVNDALSRADIVLMTGGLGPTKDDITKKTLAEMFGMKLVRNEQVYEMVGKQLALRVLRLPSSTRGKLCSRRLHGTSEQEWNCTRHVVRTGRQSSDLHAWCTFRDESTGQR